MADPTGRDGPGRCYTERLDIHSGEYLGEMEEGVISSLEGVRVPDLCRWLMGLEKVNKEELDYYLVRLREVLLAKDLAENAQPGKQFYGIQGSKQGRVMIFAGGIPLRQDGQVVGAVGVSGGSGEQDQTVAEAAAAAF